MRSSWLRPCRTVDAHQDGVDSQGSEGPGRSTHRGGVPAIGDVEAAAERIKTWVSDALRRRTEGERLLGIGTRGRIASRLLLESCIKRWVLGDGPVYLTPPVHHRLAATELWRGRIAYYGDPISPSWAVSGTIAIRVAASSIHGSGYEV